MKPQELQEPKEQIKKVSDIKDPPGITIREVFEPDMERMVKALNIVLDSSRFAKKTEQKKREQEESA
ncbi:hypothetical protein DNHGIG_31340 [Collibacillus ludicampi]|uniref:Uncharacterized protein n=1 Tax=Collibacillus ludicampi TaxID=2771369 RepID=A0AAV4LIH1_9BACL|nr:hypothetical protein [Collibacillus ludicampi]GIM47585.1 hypothetical protein DNHGIG_31340 [Collibacillus ludicampi]